MLPVQKTRVLIVDEDASRSRFLQSYLTRRNFEVSAAANGDEAIRMFRVYDPAMVVLDAMPNRSGIDTLESLKQIKPEVSVIMTSGHANPEVIFKASKLGAEDYIAKPFEPVELDRRIDRKS